jgi:putative spermidine/putrescine transport system ATP-binding protein
MATADEAPAGRPAVPVTVRQKIYLGSGWKYELLLEDGSAGVVRGTRQLDWLSSPNDTAFLTWDPRVAPELAA